MEEFYTINQAAISLKVHPLTIRRYIREGKLKAYRVGGNIRIAVNDLRNFTQSFIPRTKTSKINQHTDQQIAQTRSFSLADPLLSLRGRGVSIERLTKE
ncbi:hypothetical protein A2867_02830 [Candidatus Daviesbacteria bacterium RIFCSPHIGHO2_01_FULL_40_11]|uniref:Helix-turn-helix domain-containing protein n=1 Tax=Candidatus Daviesbacteria bacterium RIFCSPHIGHO2_01_FULL_40_11 TaxID=1797762 RepID=A0A1F5JJQ6_9BACT|nr:MAG: hypothetical protein A2867_02830 [Candidatus Daviesbacteria bacterium RIFCSPHIGHO2_01_FULL_40_11]